MNWYDYAGTAGVILIIIAYFMLQTGRWRAMYLRYTLFNLTGALLILLSLLFEFNLSAFLMETAWVAISIIGIRQAIRARGDDPA